MKWISGNVVQPSNETVKSYSYAIANMIDDVGECDQFEYGTGFNTLK